MYNTKQYKIEELERNINKSINTYNMYIEILNNLKLITKKDGSIFKDFKKSFDIESLKEYFKTKYKGYIHIDITEDLGDYKLYFDINNIKSTIYIKNRIYIDTLTKEESEKVDKSKIIAPSFTRAYYIIDTLEETQKIMDKLKNDYERYKTR